MTPTLPLARYIDTNEALQSLVADLANENLLAVDTESNSMHAYHTRVCLIQLSTRQQDYIIDPFAIENLQPLGDLFADPNIEKIFHAAEYDLILMGREYGFVVHNLFDTMYAARLCHIESFGLADLLSQFFDVDVDKSHQRDDWGQRPLPTDSLQYAQMDTHYLPALRDELRGQLEGFKRMEEAHEVFDDVLRIEAKEPGFDPDGFWKIGVPRRLKGKEMARLKELYILREQIAEAEDKPPFKVLNNNALIQLSRRPPYDYDEMFKMRHIANGFVRLYGDEVLDALKRGNGQKLPRPPRPDQPAPEILDRYNLLHQWRKNCANKRDLDSSLIISKQTLWRIAEDPPKNLEQLAQVEGVGQWRLQKYGEDLLSVITKFN